MGSFKSKMAALVIGLTSLTSAAQADCWDDCNPCCMEIEIGADWLYWTSCISDQHFAYQASPPSQSPSGAQFNTHYLCHDWDSGVRVWGGIKNIWNDFNGYLIYTYIKPKAEGLATVSGLDELAFSNSVSVSLDTSLGDRVESKWEMEYQSLDAVLSYSIDVTRNPCLQIEAFSGLTWVSMTQDRVDTLYDNFGEVGEDVVYWNRNVDVNAIGPTFGINSLLRVCDCFNIFGTIQTSLVVGESKTKEYLDEIVASEEQPPGFYNWTAKDECFCFPGLHLLAGVSYDLCVCDWTFGLRLGWEYVQWINAPSFPWYESSGGATRSAFSSQNITMQGIFAGFNAEF